MNRSRLIAAAAIVLVAASATLMVLRHSDSPSLQQGKKSAELIAPLPPPSVDSMRTALRQANVSIDRLDVKSADGIVILTGRTAEAAQRDQAAAVVKELGATRVANLIRVEARTSDDELARIAERRLVAAPELDGCRFAVRCERGVLHVNGTVISDLQKESAARVLKKIDGVVEVRSDLKKL